MRREGEGGKKLFDISVLKTVQRASLLPDEGGMKALGLVLVFVVSFHARARSVNPPSPFDLNSRRSVRGHFEKRHLFFEIETSNLGPLYSIRTRQGRVIASQFTAGRLKKEFPALLDFILRVTQPLPRTWKGEKLH